MSNVPGVGMLELIHYNFISYLVTGSLSARSFTASGSSDPGEYGRPELQLGCRDVFFVPAVFSIFC